MTGYDDGYLFEFPEALHNAVIMDLLFQVNSVCWASVTHSDSHVLYPFRFSVFLSGSYL